MIKFDVFKNYSKSKVYIFLQYFIVTIISWAGIFFSLQDFTFCALAHFVRSVCSELEESEVFRVWEREEGFHWG